MLLPAEAAIEFCYGSFETDSGIVRYLVRREEVLMHTFVLC